MTSSFHMEFPQPTLRSDIFVGVGLLEEEEMRELMKKCGSSFAVIGDEVALKLFRRHFEPLSAHFFSFPPGEASKSGTVKLRIEGEMVGQGLGRESAVIALGGGIAGDLAGFIAATFCRGIPWIYVPTTLLAMVDSCIGGKTAINLPQGKNLSGAFHPPRYVISDLKTLKSLPTNEWRQGRAEIIKHGLTLEPKLLEMEDLREIVLTSCRVKGEVVIGDMKEGGKRAVLNFGHTIGHALERISGYALPHGDAVARGMLFESLISVKKGLLKEEAIPKITKILLDSGFTLDLPEGASLSKLLETMAFDKKRIKGELRMSLLKSIGHAAHVGKEWTFPVTKREVENALEKYGPLAHSKKSA